MLEPSACGKMDTTQEEIAASTDQQQPAVATQVFHMLDRDPDVEQDRACYNISSLHGKACQMDGDTSDRMPSHRRDEQDSKQSPDSRGTIVDSELLGSWATHADSVLPDVAPSGTSVTLPGGDRLYLDDRIPRFARSDDANRVVCLWHGDITQLRVDGTVNAANEGLWAGGGICGAIHSAAGPRLAEECSTIGTPPKRCPIGQTVITHGYQLAAKYVLHTVGPTSQDHKQLTSCYATTLDLAAANGLRSVALCCVSTGIFGFPRRIAAHIALGTVRQWLDYHKGVLEKVVFAVFLQREREIYEHLLPCYFPRLGDVELEGLELAPPIPDSPRKFARTSSTEDEDASSEGDLLPCRFGKGCRQMHDADHCATYSHPERSDVGAPSSTYRPIPCRYGARCRQIADPLHGRTYSHPGGGGIHLRV